MSAVTTGDEVDEVTVVTDTLTVTPSPARTRPARLAKLAKPTRLARPTKPARPTEPAQPAKPQKAARGHLTWPRRTWALEVGSVIAFDALYETVRAAAPAHRDLAYTNAAKIMDVETWSHLDIELGLNRALTAHPLLGALSGYYYSTLFFALTPLLLVWLWARRPASYAWLRSALVLSTFVALIGYWTFPVAPPRFALPGATDTMASLDVLGAARPHTIAGLINNYAAMPSLHVAWATWCAAAVVVATTSRWRHLAWIYPATTTLVVLATANHYLLDTLVGMALVAAAILLTRPRREATRQVLALAPA